MNVKTENAQPVPPVNHFFDHAASRQFTRVIPLFLVRLRQATVSNDQIQEPKLLQHQESGSDMEKQVAMSYPTPIGRFRLPDTEAVNLELRRVILDKERSTPSDNYANVGGWHSAGDLLEWPTPAVCTLRTWILEAVTHMSSVTSDGQAQRGMLKLSAWANVARLGNYHRVHNHPSSAWSGVYYVNSCPEPANHPLSGVLELCDPRPFTEMVPTPGNPYGKRVIFRSEAGTMIVFPSWLYHFVNPFHGEGERISIAFNVQWQNSPV